MTLLKRASEAVMECIDSLSVEDCHDFEARIARAVLEAVRVAHDDEDWPRDVSRSQFNDGIDYILGK